MSRGDSRKGRARRAAAITRSGLRRYPRVLTESVTRPRLGVDSPTNANLHAVHEHDPLAAAWLGHASVLLRQSGRTLLTDPVFSHRVGLRVGPITFGPHRLEPPAATPDELPPIDLILISHAHFDHLDRPSLLALESSGTTVVTSRGTRRLIPRGFRHVIELDEGESEDLGPMRITALPAAHWGARAVIDRHRGCNAYLIESDDAASFFSGDTAHTHAFDELRAIDLAIFGIGAYDPWEHKHATPEQAWAMFSRMGAGRLLPVHHSTFELSEEMAHEPMQRLRTAAGADLDRLIDLPPGAIWTSPERLARAKRA